MKQILIIKNWDMDLNTYINQERGHWSKAAAIKKDLTFLVKMEAKSQKLKIMQSPIAVTCIWETKNEKKDPDNLAFGLKFILDGLVQAGILKNDGYGDIISITHFFAATGKDQVNVTLYNDQGEVKKDA
jgi:Holliday junction resolvase RusA-like endonuclease